MNRFRLALIAAPLLLLVACGGGGGGDDGSNTNPLPDGGSGGSGGAGGAGGTGGTGGSGGSGGTGGTGGTGGSGGTGQSTAALLNEAIADVPVVGEVVADCGDTGIGEIDSIVDAVGGISGGALPDELPSLEDLLLLADLEGLPLIGGVVPSGDVLDVIAGDSLVSLVPGVGGLGSLPVLGQMPTVCSSLLGEIPLDAFLDPMTLLETLGDPTSALGVIAVLDDAGIPVGVILATLPADLTDTGSIFELLPFDPSDVPGLGGLVESLLGILDGGGVGGLGGLLGLLDLLGFLLP